MGFILSKFRKTKPSVKDTLDKIEQDLRKLSRFQYDTELQQKRIIGRLVIFGIFLYLIFLVLVYFFGPRDLSWKQTVAWIVPFVLFPILIIAIKRGLAWYYNRKIVKNKGEYESLKKEKQRLLDEVMEKETFKVAKEILEKYAPSQLLPKYLAEQQKSLPSSPMGMTPVPRNAPGLRRRSNPPGPVPYSSMGGYTPRAIRPYMPSGSGPHGPGQFLRQPTNNFMRPALMPAPSSNSPSPQNPMLRGPPPPRLMLPPPPTNPEYRTRKTGWLDKLVDYVVGDGPSNRFALICRYCATHNGLATPDDFPYIGYRCVYCRQFNPPRQQRPSAPTLPRNTVLIEELDSTIKSPDISVNESSTQENETEGNTQDSPSKGESENKENGDPVVELAASSTEDLTRSVDSLQVDDDDIGEVEDFPNDDDDSLAADTTFRASSNDIAEENEPVSSPETDVNNESSQQASND